MARLTWVLAVAGLMNRAAAIWSLLRPPATRATISRSRSVRVGQGGGIDRPVLGPGHELGDQPPGRPGEGGASPAAATA